MNNEHIADYELLLALDGQAEPSVVEALKHSAGLQQRAAQLTQAQQRLTNHLFRRDCPDSLNLAEYQAGLLEPAESKAIKQHLSACPHCTQELAETKHFLAEVGPNLEPGLIERVKVLIARLVPPLPDTLLPIGRPALAGVRGAEDGPLLYEAGEVQVSVGVQEDATRPGYKSILGLIIGVMTNDWQVQLWRDGQTITTGPVDELGNFLLDGLEPGPYELTIRGDDTEIYIQELTV